MKGRLEEFRQILLDATLKGLRDSSDQIKTIEQTETGITGISLDVYPWFGDMTISIRISTDWPLGSHAYDTADWKYHDFLKSWGTNRFKEAGRLIQTFYEAAKPAELRERAHLVFLAAAEALLDPQIAAHLQMLGIEAPVVNDRFVQGIEYIVRDEDRTIKANYCEIVLANRVTNRLIGEAGRTSRSS